MEAHAGENERASGYGVFDESPAVLKDRVCPNLSPPFPPSHSLTLPPQIRKLEVELRLAKKGDATSASASTGDESLEEKVAILEVPIRMRPSLAF
jgi:hypothetical protein